MTWVRTEGGAKRYQSPDDRAEILLDTLAALHEADGEYVTAASLRPWWGEPQPNGNHVGRWLHELRELGAVESIPRPNHPNSYLWRLTATGDQCLIAEYIEKVG